MRKLRIGLLIVGVLLIFVPQLIFGQPRDEKTTAIINKLDMVESLKQMYSFQQVSQTEFHCKLSVI